MTGSGQYPAHPSYRIFGGDLYWRKQQERPDGSLWTVAVYLDGNVQVVESFDSLEAADAWIASRLEEGSLR